MKFRHAFTMLELIFVIVVMGILGKFGVEFLARAYQSFIFSKVNHTLQSHSASTVEFISTRLQSRIKDSIIARIPGDPAPNFDALADVNISRAQEYTVLEWISADIDGFRGDNMPYWSGIADIDASNASLIVSPETNTTAINDLIKILANYTASGDTTIDNAALYFVGSNSDITTDYGWSGNTAYMQDQNGSMHPINITGVGDIDEFKPDNTNFTDIYEYYKLAWTAYAVVLNDGNLTLHSDYQPWEGDSYLNAEKQDLLMQDVDTFQFMAIGSIVKIQVCMKTDLVEEYSLCKEKTIY